MHPAARGPRGLRPGRAGGRAGDRGPLGDRRPDRAAARRAGGALCRPRPVRAARAASRSRRRPGPAGTRRQLVLGHAGAGLADLCRGHAGRVPDQPVRARRTFVHHERLRPGRAEQGDRDALGAGGWRAHGVPVRFPFAQPARLLRRQRRADGGPQARQPDLRAGHGHQDGGPTALGRRIRQQPARVREPARLFHLGLAGGPGRPAVRPPVHRGGLAVRRPGRAGAGAGGAPGDRGRAGLAAAAQPGGAPLVPGCGAKARRAGREHRRPGDHQEHGRRGPHAAQLGAVRRRHRGLGDARPVSRLARRQLLAAGAEPGHGRRGGLWRLSDRRWRHDGRRPGGLHDHHGPGHGAPGPGRRRPDAATIRRAPRSTRSTR